MKQSRRHELKTNELSLWLQQTYAAAARHSNYLFGGVVVVVLILVIALYVQNRRHQAREDAWSRYYDLLGDDPGQKPEVMDQARRFAEEHSGDGDLGPRALLMTADMAAVYANEVDPLKDSDKRLSLLKEARQTYTRIINEHADQPKLVARARMGLASVLESQVLAGQATVEEVRKQYQALEQSEPGLYTDTVKYLAGTLDDRVKPLKLVATRPAEPPASAPATRAASAPATRPAAEVVETAPAVQETPGQTTQPAIYPPPLTTAPAPPPATAPAP